MFSAGMNDRHLPAAVLPADANDAALTVPPRAIERRIGGTILGYDHVAARIGGHWILPRQRIKEIGLLIRHRHSTTYCDTADGEIYLAAAATHFDNEAHCRKWAENWTPLLNITQIGRAYNSGLNIGKRTADQIANDLRVTKHERSSLKLTTIGAVDFNKAQRIQARRDKHREASRARRLAAGAIPRSESSSQQKPWLSAGYNSRRTWERNGKCPRDPGELPTPAPPPHRASEP